MQDISNLFTPDKLIPSTSTPKTESKKTGAAGKKPAKLTGTKSSNSSKRNRSSGSGTTPEGKKYHPNQSGGLTDETVEAFGEFSASWEEDGAAENSLSSIEKQITSNKKLSVVLKRSPLDAVKKNVEAPPPTSTGSKRPSNPQEIKGVEAQPPKVPKMSNKRTGIEIKIYKKHGEGKVNLSKEEWESIKSTIQEYLFDREMYAMFEKIKRTPWNSEEDVSYGALSFASTEDLDEMAKHIRNMRFTLHITWYECKPSKWLASFRIHGMTAIDPKKIVAAMIKLNKLSGTAIEVKAKLTPAGDARYITISPDDILLEELREKEANGIRLKTGFSNTTVRIYNAEEKKE